MTSEEFRQFLAGVAVLTAGAFVVGAIFSPPDPYTQLASTAVLVPVAVVGSYALAYRHGFEWS